MRVLKVSTSARRTLFLCAALFATLAHGQAQVVREERSAPLGPHAADSAAPRESAEEGNQTEEIIALERLALDRWGKGDPQDFLQTYAPDVTYFDPFVERRIDGLDAMKEMLAPVTGRIKVDRYDMLNPRVQRHGDVAVLTYNLVNYMRQPDGSERATTRWNSTSVFRRVDGRWRTIHSHWSLVKPELKPATLEQASPGAQVQDGDAPPFSPPGQMADMGGWRLHLNCTGSASPAQSTVILEPGIGDFSVEWSLVQPRVADFARVCSYDRAGDGWSDLGPHPRTMRQIVHELHTLLNKAGERPPYVLVGHSYGGWLARRYASTYPAEVAGIVLVEGGADNPWRMLSRGKLVRSAELATGKAIPAVKTSGPLRVSEIPPPALRQMKAGLAEASRRANEAPRDKLPPDAQRMRTWALGQLGHVAAAVNPFLEEELAELRAERTKNERLYGDMPLVEITRGVSEEEGPDSRAFEGERRKEHAELASLSHKGKHIIAAQSGHHVQLDEPELVVTAIQQVVAAAPRAPQAKTSRPGVPNFKQEMESRALSEIRPKAVADGLQIASTAFRADAPEDTPRPPGRLVDLGGYKLHLHCTGSGDPTVVLVAGAGDFSFDWSLVQVSASHKTRVCSYDRAGLAWSDVGPLPRTMRQDAYELHRLLELAGVKAPYVLVGHSAGGLLVRVYAMEYPEDVAGLVLVDPTHEDTTLMYQGKIVRVRDSSKGRPIPAPQTMYSNPPKQPTKEERKQYLQMFGPPQIKLPFNRLSSEAQRWRLWALSARNPGAEWDDSIWADELEALGRARAMTKLPLADRPLVVLVADKGWPPTGEEQKRLAEEKRAQKLGLADLSSRARTVLIDKSGHHIQLEAPDVVVEAISEVVVFVLGPRALASALDTFKGALDERWSYRYANGADFDMPIAALRKRIDAGISLDEFGIELQKIIALGIDGHSRVSGYRLPPGGRLPFLIEAEGERFVALDPERSAFLANGFPFLTKIEGKPVAEWCTSASVLVPKGSPQYVRHRCLLHLRELDYWRGELDLPKKDVVEVELADQDDRARKTLTLPVSQSLPAHGVWPPGDSRLLDGNIGYLRLASMQKATSVAEIKQWMPRFRDSTGLIVDVRDNNGGERDALLLLYSYLAGPDDPSRVFTAAAYRLHEKHKENHLAENHFMYRARDRKWTTKERQAIAEFAKNFKPEWELPRGQFSEWHYLALNRSEDRDLYHYDKPVIVLINAKCFSATDIFLNGLKGMKNVVLLGTPSSGGSAFTQEIMLGVTPLRLRIGSMASFQADGKLFDRNGIHPDVLSEPVPEYYIGGRDNQLEEAVKRIRNR